MQNKPRGSVLDLQSTSTLVPHSGLISSQESPYINSKTSLPRAPPGLRPSASIRVDLHKSSILYRTSQTSSSLWHRACGYHPSGSMPPLRATFHSLMLGSYAGTRGALITNAKHRHNSDSTVSTMKSKGMLTKQSSCKKLWA